MNIGIIERDKENKHYDIYVNSIRTHKIRGKQGNYYIQCEDKFGTTHDNFKSIDICLMYLFTLLLKKL